MKKKSNPESSLFITFEGGEGAGKTTLMNALERELLAQGIPVVRTREPGGTPLGEQIRSWLLTRNSVSVCDRAELMLFLAARAQHIEEVIAPALEAGKVVLCDRFNDSTAAYQGGARKLGVAYVRQLCNELCRDVLPDLTLYLDVDPNIGLTRTRKAVKENARSGDVDRIESERLQFHEDVRKVFIDIGNGEPERFHILNANKPQDEVIAAARNIVFSKLKLKSKT